MEESKNLKSIYTGLRTLVYASIMLEFFMFVVSDAMLEHMGDWVVEIHQRMKTLTIYQDGNLALSKLATVLLVFITCIGTKNKKHIEFDAQRMVFIPVTVGFLLVALSLWLYFTDLLEFPLWGLTLGTYLYMLTSILGVLGIHVALDNASKYLKDGMLKDRFNFENESFEQNEEFKETPYSVNIPMRYYYKGKFRHGWININNPFRGTFVVGTPGSGKTFSIIEPYIRQHAAKGFAMVVYDYKFPTLAQ